jgi:hypothetical protein
VNALGKEHRLKVYKKWVLRRPFGHNREEITVIWEKLYYEEFNRSFLPDVIKIIILR